MIVNDLIFVECDDGLGVPVLGEDGRLDFISRRRFEVEAHYRQLIGDYEDHLKGIRNDLIRYPHDHNLHQMEYLYKQRLEEARRKRDAKIEELQDEERRLQRLEAERRREQDCRRPPNLRGQLMYGFVGA